MRPGILSGAVSILFLAPASIADPSFGLVHDQRYVRGIGHVWRGTEQSGGDASENALFAQPFSALAERTGMIGASRGYGLGQQVSTFSPVLLAGSGRAEAGSAREATADFAYGGAFSEYLIIFRLDEPALLRFSGELSLTSSGIAEASIRERPSGAYYHLRDIRSSGSLDFDRIISLPSGEYELRVGGAVQYAASSPSYFTVSTGYSFTLQIIPAPACAGVLGALVVFRRRRASGGR